MIVDKIEDVEGKWVNEYVKVLTVPKFQDGMWKALAIVHQALCVIELNIKEVQKGDVNALIVEKVK